MVVKLILSPPPTPLSPPGYYGRGCTDACHLNPCENEAKCHRKPSSSHGYTCDCGDNHYGQYCQHRIDHQCPRGWWGSPTCGPCHCDANKGFDPDCNKTSGLCHCKEFHYRVRGSDTCLPCDCYPVGSFSRSCDPETGQCQCRPGVIGRQCNACDSPFAEVTTTGCDVIYDGCPKTITQGIWWPRTKFNLPAAVPCPKGSVGAAIRHCDAERGWLEPDLYNCTSPPFVELNAALDSLERNETELNTIMEKKLAHQLRDVTEATTRLYGNDLQIAERLLSRLLTFETQQTGFGLTATQDAHFNENLVRGCSVLLGPGTSGLWRALAQSQNHIPGGGPAELTELLEQYTQNLAQNMKLTYLNPVALVAPNIVMNLDRVENQTHVRRRFPRYHTTLFRGQTLWDPNTHVILPPAALVPQRQQQQHSWKEKERTEKERAEKEPAGAQNTDPASISISANQTGEYTAARRTVSLPEPPITIVILLIYRSLGGALPPKYHTDRRGVRLPRHPVMNSPVVSVSVFNNQTFVGGHLDQPILLEFKLLETANRSKPLCVQWNHSNQYEIGGCWTVRDCMVVYRNTSHVRCQCQRLGTFGVLMDSSHREQLEGDLETLALITYSCLCLSMMALLFTVLVLSCLRGLKSNMRSIHSNTAAAMFLSELVFLLGVNQTEQQFLCTVVAILLHYFFMSTFAWMFVEGLHIYRMQTEQRNINYGAMRFYYAIGWGVPAIITGLAVGLDPEGYGNPDFCWISIYDKLIWSFAGPIAIVILMNGGIFMIVAKMSCNPSQKETKKLPVIATIRNAFLLLLVATSTWLCGLMAVNNSILAFYYIFDVLCLVQGLSVMLVFTLFNSEVKEAWSVACLGKKSPGEDPPRPSQNTDGSTVSESIQKSSDNVSMDFLEGSTGIYRPIRVLFDTPIYERALQICWHISSYKTKIALVIELLRLQQKDMIPSEVTVDDMTDLLREESKSSLRVQLWDFELEDRDEDVAKPLLNLLWEVINSMKMRDIVFEARRLLMSPDDIPAGFRHPKLMNLAQEYGRRLTERLQSAPSSELLGPRDVVLQVVTFSCSIRDAMVLSIQEKVRQMYPAQDIRRRELNSFAAQILNTIADAAANVVDGAETIHTLAGDVNEELGLEEDREPIQEPVSSPSPTPLTPTLLSSVTTADEPPAITVTQDGLTTSQTDPVELCTPETDCEDVELSREQGPAVTLALTTPHDGPVVMTAAQDERTIRKREVKRKRRVQPFLVQKQSDAAACLKTQTENAQNPYHNASLLEQSGLHRITLGTSTISSVSSARENLLARQTLEQNIVQTGATDLDVAMFHRDGGEDSDSDSDLSMDEERSLSIPSSESEDNVRLRGRIQRRFKRSNHSERLLTEPAHNGTKDLDGNDLLSYWPALEECETHSLQKWGSERPLGSDYSKDAANNNQTDAALTSGDENGLTQPNRHRKGILKNRIGCPPALQGLSSIGRTPSDLNWYRTSTLGHRGVPAASYGRMYSATGAGGGSGSLSQPGSRYSSREQLDSLSRRQLSRETLGRQAVGGSRDRLDSRGSRDNLDLLPRRRELGLGQGAGLGGLGLEHQRVSSSRENLSGSRDRLDLQHTGSVHASREDLSGNVGAGGMEGFLSGSRSHLNSLTRRQASSREHLGGALMSSRSREQLEPNGGGAQPCREWLRTLPPRQPAHPDQPPSSSPPPPISEEPPQEQLPPHVRGRLDSAPPCRYTGQTVPQGAGSNPNALGRQPSCEHLDILSSILASFSSTVLTPPPSNPGPNGSAHGPSPSPPHSATSHSISEVSPDSEANRSEGQS
ncbi:hypothetical protein NQZ68_000545 [Dissostichus eleginoides]|nr:hypothetical protein NQZ68_000545 [Dissostichus eleginoides]